MADARATVIASGPGAVVVALHWHAAGDGDPVDHEQFQVLRFRDGRVVDMDEHRTPEAARRAAGL